MSSQSIFANHGARHPGAGAVRRVDLTGVNLEARLAQCEACKWNVGNRCQHLGQKCAPCKQGRGLRVALTRASFRCPKGDF